MTEEQQAVLFAASDLYRHRHWRGTSASTAHDMDAALLRLDTAVGTLLDAEAAARVRANPLSKLGG